MYRIVLAAAAGLAITGCSLSPQSLSLDLNRAPATKIDPNFVNGGSLGDHADSATPRIGSANNQDNIALRSTARRGLGLSPTSQRAPQANLNVALARRMINAYRKRNGLKPLAIDPQLTAAALAHARDLAKWDRISHYGSDGSNPWDRVRRSGYKAQLTAENVGTGQITLKEVIAGWKKSESHNENLLLNDAKHMGIALVHNPKSKFQTFWTLVLGAKG